MRGKEPIFMAKTTLNSALKTISGGIDNWVYRQHAGKTVISPRTAPTGPVTPAQQAVRDRFREAAAYAKSVFATPALRSVYEAAAQQMGITMFAAAVADYLNPPEVDDIDLTGYHGSIGDRIIVRASDDIGVTAVSVAIRAEDLTLLEEGAAVLQGGVWVYIATTARPAGQPLTITATAVDHASRTGNKLEIWN
jgi:hypothetical protein